MESDERRPGTFAPGEDDRRGKGPAPGTGGRPTNAFKSKLRELLDDAETLQYFGDCLRGKYGPQFHLSALRLAAEYAHGKPVQPMTLAIDWGALSDEQVQRIAQGEDPERVLAGGGLARGWQAPPPYTH